MKYIKFTYVDAATGISVASQPAAAGPVYPVVQGLVFSWARESQYPTPVPELFGTCPDGANTRVDGVLAEYNRQEWEALRAAEMQLRGSNAQATALAQAKAARIAAIKAEAAAHLEATAWRVERAREREQAGFASVADLAAVLAQREAIRRSSDAAEAATRELTDIAAVQALAWRPDDVQVPAPRLLTHEQLIQRFTESEWEAMTQAARDNTAMDAWMRRFSMATVINLDDVATQAGVQALEIAGLLAAGRAEEVLA